MKLFRNKDFWAIWFIGLTHNIMKWLEILAVGVVVFEITGSPFYVALMVIVRFIPLSFFGFFNGLIAERINRRMALFYVFLFLSICCFGYALSIHHDEWIKRIRNSKSTRIETHKTRPFVD